MGRLPTGCFYRSTAENTAATRNRARSSQPASPSGDRQRKATPDNDRDRQPRTVSANWRGVGACLRPRDDADRQQIPQRCDPETQKATQRRDCTITVPQGAEDDCNDARRGIGDKQPHWPPLCQWRAKDRRNPDGGPIADQPNGDGRHMPYRRQTNSARDMTPIVAAIDACQPTPAQSR